MSGFRQLTRKKQQLEEGECIDLQKKKKRGVLSVLGDDGYPYGTPINHYYNEEDGKIYFHGNMSGHKVDAMKRCDKVSFCVMDEGCHNGDDWFLTVRSVIAFGRMEFIEDRGVLLDIARKLCHKFTDDEQYIEDEIRNSGPRTLMYAMTIENLCGKRVSER